MVRAKVITIARGKCALNYSHRPGGSGSVTLTIPQGTSVEEVTILAQDPSDLEPLFGYLPENED
jgi:hypothetical protein